MKGIWHCLRKIAKIFAYKNSKIHNKVMLLLSHVLPGDSEKCFIKGVLPHRLVLSFSETWAKILTENPFMKFSIVMEFLLNDFLPLVSSYGNLCFKGARRNLKWSTEKNQNLKKDQLKKFFFSMAGFLSLDIEDTLDQIIPFMLIASPTFWCDYQKYLQKLPNVALGQNFSG